MQHPRQRKPTARPIDVEGLPDPIARTLRAMADTLRAQLRRMHRGGDAGRHGARFLERPGSVIGSIHRRDVYEDVG